MMSIPSPTPTARRLLMRYPWLIHSYGEDTQTSAHSRLERILDLVIKAPKRPRRTMYYLQAIALDDSAFLSTNLPDNPNIHLAPIAATWLLGRHEECAIPIPLASISRFHAAIGYSAAVGFYLVDLKSLNGTRLNGETLQSMKKYPLHHGDRIEMSHLPIEFSIAHPVAEPLDWITTSDSLDSLPATMLIG
ncbi:MAG: FHA domain-containing protein [Synechococcales bacterium]|nr:FHA domain-containing protein [Synechococcales bacterium]